MRDGAAVARAFVWGGSSVLAIVDVDGDGRDELVVVGGSMAQGVLEEQASLESIGPRGLQQRRDFGMVHEDTCGGIVRPEDRKETSNTVTARRSSSGEVSFSTATRTRACK